MPTLSWPSPMPTTWMICFPEQPRVSTKVKPEKVPSPSTNLPSPIAKNRFFSGRPGLSLAEISFEVGVNSSYLAQMFHKYYGETIGGYQRRLRVEFARQKLANTDASLCDVVLLAGFSDQSHLTRIFKRYMGVTPVQNRKSLGNS